MRFYSHFSWLQPEPHLDPKRCEVVYNADDMKCSWPSVITVLTRDQYGHLVVVVDLLVSPTINTHILVNF